MDRCAARLPRSRHRSLQRGDAPPYHTTAHCIAALELFDARPKYELTDLHRYLDREELYLFLVGLHWERDPWIASHQGAGIYAALVLAGETTRTWQDWYFSWLYDEADPATGFWRKDHVIPTARGIRSPARSMSTVFPHLARFLPLPLQPRVRAPADALSRGCRENMPRYL